MLSLIGLFLAAFAAATLVPAQSEAVLAGMTLAATHPVWILLVVATSGNVLGSTVNWLLGRFLMRHADHRWFPVSRAHLDRASRWYARWGYPSLLLSWVPVIGDPLTLAAGILREPFWRFVLIVTLAKAGRYVILVWATVSLA